MYNEKDDGWVCQKQNSGSQKLDLRCACGSKVHFITLLDKTGYTVNELYCPDCGLSMRSPGFDKDGKELKQRWAQVISQTLNERR